MWAQAGREIRTARQTRADLCPFPIPITRGLTAQEVADDYEGATGTVLIEALAAQRPARVPCALVYGHSPFCWGADATAAVEHAVILEEVARMALFTTVPERGSLSLAPACARSTTPASTGRGRITGRGEPRGDWSLFSHRHLGDWHELACDRCLADFLAAQLGGQLAVHEDQHTVTEVRQLLEVARADHHRGAVRRRSAQLTMQIGLGAHVNALSWLIEQEDRRAL